MNAGELKYHFAALLIVVGAVLQSAAAHAKVDPPSGTPRLEGMAGDEMRLSRRGLPSSLSRAAPMAAAALGYDQIEVLRFPSPKFATTIEVMRFVPHDWDARKAEAIRLVTDVFAPMAATASLVVVVDAVRETEDMKNLSESNLDRHDWAFWRASDLSWRLVDASPRKYIDLKAKEAATGTDGYALAYWSWWQGVHSASHNHPTKALEAFNAAEAALTPSMGDPLQLRAKLAAGLLRIHAERRDSGQAARYARELATAIAADMTDVEPHAVYTVAPEFKLPSLAPNEVEATIEFTVDDAGRPRDAHVIHAQPPAFGRAVVDALDNWWYVPRIVDGQAVPTAGMMVRLGMTR